MFPTKDQTTDAPFIACSFDRGVRAPSSTLETEEPQMLSCDYLVSFKVVLGRVVHNFYLIYFLLSHE